MYHLCLDARLYFSGGIGTFLQGLIRLLLKGPYRLSLLCHAEELEELYSELCLQGSATARWQLIPMKSPIYSLQEQWYYPRLIPRCDLFWAPHFNVPLSVIRARKRLTTLHDVYHLAYCKQLPRIQRSYAHLMYRSALLLSDHLTTGSLFSLGEIQRLCRSCFQLRTHQISFFPPPLNVPERSLESLPTSEERDCLLAVGQIKPHKNLRRLVAAYRTLEPKEPLYLVGKKEGLLTLDHSLFEQVSCDPFLKRQVHFTGQIEQTALHALYRKAKLFLFPSLYEGFGIPPLEAMAFGCPVIASHAAAIPEVCGEAVEYIDPYSVDALREAMRRVLEDPSRQDFLRRAGLMHLTQWQAQPFKDKLEQLLKKVVET